MPSAETLTKATPAPPAPADPAAELETLLLDMIEAHEQMLQIAADHRRAISRADAASLQACVEQQAVVAARVVELEGRRKLVVRVICPTAEIPTVSAVVERVAEPLRGRLTAAAAKLRDLVKRVQRDLAVIRMATQSMVGHIDGLMQQVAIALSHTRLYDPRGRIHAGAATPCGLDLTH